MASQANRDRTRLLPLVPTGATPAARAHCDSEPAIGPRAWTLRGPRLGDPFHPLRSRDEPRLDCRDLLRREVPLDLAVQPSNRGVCGFESPLAFACQVHLEDAAMRRMRLALDQGL